MIGFLHPWALAGLAAAAIPVLLHLLARREPPTVVFPAVRYLITTTREHQRRLKLQNLLLLLLRTLLIVALVLAAAGPRAAPRRGGPRAERAGADRATTRRAAARWWPARRDWRSSRRPRARCWPARRPDDALWLIQADGVPRRGDRPTLMDQVGGLAVSPRRLDLGAAVASPPSAGASDARPGEIMLLTDLQASALSPAEPRVPLVVGRPDEPPPANVGIAGLETGPQPWTPDGGRLTVSLAGDSGGGLP